MDNDEFPAFDLSLNYRTDYNGVSELKLAAGISMNVEGIEPSIMAEKVIITDDKGEEHAMSAIHASLSSKIKDRLQVE